MLRPLHSPDINISPSYPKRHENRLNPPLSSCFLTIQKYISLIKKGKEGEGVGGGESMVEADKFNRFLGVLVKTPSWFQWSLNRVSKLFHLPILERSPEKGSFAKLILEN